MEQIVHLLIALLTVVNTFYQYKTERQVFHLKAEVRRRQRRRKPQE